MDKSKKGHSKLIIACSDPAENFKFIEETLNQVAFLKLSYIRSLSPSLCTTTTASFSPNPT